MCLVSQLVRQAGDEARKLFDGNDEDQRTTEPATLPDRTMEVQQRVLCRLAVEELSPERLLRLGGSLDHGPDLRLVAPVEDGNLIGSFALCDAQESCIGGDEGNAPHLRQGGHRCLETLGEKRPVVEQVRSSVEHLGNGRGVVADRLQVSGQSVCERIRDQPDVLCQQFFRVLLCDAKADEEHCTGRQQRNQQHGPRHDDGKRQALSTQLQEGVSSAVAGPG